MSVRENLTPNDAIENRGYFQGALGSQLVARCRTKVASGSLCSIYRRKIVPK